MQPFNTIPTPLPSRAAASATRHALALCTAVLAAGSALAATPPANSAAQARYQQERAVCLNGQSNQDRATCLREANAALAEAKRDGLDSGGANLIDNQRKRCDRLSGDERSACSARMQGAGSTSGSVAGGGILRELVTVQPAAPAAPASPAAPAAAKPMPMPMPMPMPNPAPTKP